MNTGSHTERSGLARRLQGVLAARMLDLGFAGQIAALSPDQRRAIFEWQRTARVYELIQQVARRKIALDHLSAEVAVTVRAMTLDLNRAIEQSRLPGDLVLYRGIRHLRKTFGTQNPKDLQGKTHVDLGFLASSVHAEIALRDFTTPRGALIIMHVPKGSQALWVARAGDPQLSWQGEVLLQPRLAFRIQSIDEQHGLPLLSGAVMQ